MQLSQEILVAIRDRRSRQAMSRRLGYGFNQYSKWETGQKRILWTEFVQVTRSLQLPLSAVMKSCFHFEGDPACFEDWVSHLTRGSSAVDIAGEAGMSVHKVRRWLSGASVPTLQDILILIEIYVPARTYDFLGGLVDIQRIPSLRDEYLRREKVKNLIHRFPFLSGVAGCFTLREYKELSAHREGFVARTLGITLEQEREAVRYLSEVGAIALADGKYRSKGNTLLTKVPYGQNRPLRKYWLERAIEFLDRHEEQPKGTFVGYIAFGTDEETRRKVIEKCQQFMEDLRKLLPDSDEADSVRVLNLNVIDPGASGDAGRLPD